MIKNIALITSVFSLGTTVIRFALPDEIQNAIPKAAFYVFSSVLGYLVGIQYERRVKGKAHDILIAIGSGLLGIGVGWIVYEFFLILLVFIFMLLLLFLLYMFLAR